MTTPEKRHVSEQKQGTRDDTQAKRRESESTAATNLDFQNGDVRAAVFGLLKNDEDIMATIIDAVSQAIVKKLLDTPSFLTSLAQNVTESGVLSGVKEKIYQSCVMETAQMTDELRRLEQRVSDLETANTALRDDSDAQEQYSRRKCLLVHGIPEDQTDNSDADCRCATASWALT